MTKDDIEAINKFKILTAKNEQLPYKFPNTKFFTMPMGHGDYTIEYNNRAYYSKIVAERKSSVTELYEATGSQRARWERELENLSKIDIKVVLCEFSYLDIVNKQNHGKLSSASVYGSICKWQAVYGIPFIFCENRANARNFLYKMFFEYVKYKILKLK